MLLTIEDIYLIIQINRGKSEYKLELMIIATGLQVLIWKSSYRIYAYAIIAYDFWVSTWRGFMEAITMSYNALKQAKRTRSKRLHYMDPVYVRWIRSIAVGSTKFGKEMTDLLH